MRDNFFEWGGHSLLAVRLLAAIKKSFKQRIPLAKIFEAPTIEQLADILCQEGVSTEHSSIKPQPANKKLTSYLNFLAKLTLQEKVVHFVDRISNR